MKSKKRILLLACLSVLIVAVIAVNFTGSSVFGQKKIVIKLGDDLSPSHPHEVAFRFFAKRVAELTDGQVEVQIYPNSQLGTHPERIQGLQLGTIEMTKTTNADMGNFVEETKVFDLPFLFRDKEHFYKVLDGPIGKKFLNEIYPKVGLKGLIFLDSGTRSVYNSKRPIRTPQDLKGVKIRVMPSEIMIDTINAMGASAVPMSFAELYSAMQQGVVDGAENSPTLYYEQKHYEVAPYLSLTEHFGPPDILLISQNFFDRLPKNVQKAILQAAEETKDYQRKIWIESEEKVIEQIKAVRGVQVNTVDTEAFSQAVQPIYEKYGSKYADTIEKIRATK